MIPRKRKASPSREANATTKNQLPTRIVETKYAGKTPS
jgi:hypothetical protein